MSRRKRFVPRGIDCKHTMGRVQDQIAAVLLNNGICSGLNTRNLLDDLTNLVSELMLDHADEIFQSCIKVIEND